jgi:hypothetical protein
VRSLGKKLPEERITLNAFCPNVVRTNFSIDTFYDAIEKEDLLTPMEGVLEVCEMLLGTDDVSGECFEIGPNYAKGEGLVRPKFAPLEDEGQQRVFEKITARGNAR